MRDFLLTFLATVAILGSLIALGAGLIIWSWWEDDDRSGEV
jgi:hypothetical protein